MTITTPIIIDIEASGFGAGSYPIEIGLALEDGSSYCRLIKPEVEWTHWDERSAQVHGILRDNLFLHGLDVRSMAQQLNQMLADKTVYSDGWGFDSSWLALLFDHAELRCHFRLEALQCLLDQQQMEQWQQQRQQIEQQLRLTRHRASNDARILQQTYLALASEKNRPPMSTKPAQAR